MSEEKEEETESEEERIVKSFITDFDDSISKVTVLVNGKKVRVVGGGED